eukprot:2492025-Prymnesium_polylepis.1
MSSGTPCCGRAPAGTACLPPPALLPALPHAAACATAWPAACRRLRCCLPLANNCCIGVFGTGGSGFGG